MDSAVKIHIYCAVIDHFGDAGISYRVARELSRNAGYKVSLFINDLTPLLKIVPGINPALAIQYLDNIQLAVWEKPKQHTREKAAVILEMFGCFSERQALSPEQQDILVINIEYLSAEDWTLAHHLLPSPRPEGRKYFYFLGWQPASGGILYEQDYLTRFNRFHCNLNRQQELRSCYSAAAGNKKIMFIFGYPSSVWGKWRQIWQKLNLDYELWLADAGRLLTLGNARIGQYRAVNLPFVPQADFDELLWLADIAVVRGEDSFSRAGLAGMPFLWHTYPQEQNARKAKLRAFWRQWQPLLPPKLWTAHQLLSDELNDITAYDNAAVVSAWNYVLTHVNDWKKAARTWQKSLLSNPSAFEKLTRFIKKQLE